MGSLFETQPFTLALVLRPPDVEID
jgi:hypothetical protein